MFSCVLTGRSARQPLRNWARKGVWLARPLKVVTQRPHQELEAARGQRAHLPCFPSAAWGWQPSPLSQESCALQKEEKRAVNTRLRVAEALALRGGGWKQVTSPFSTGGLRTERRTANGAGFCPGFQKGPSGSREGAQNIELCQRNAGRGRKLQPAPPASPRWPIPQADGALSLGTPRSAQPSPLGLASQGRGVAKSSACSTQNPTCRSAQQNKHALDQARRLPGTAGLPRTHVGPARSRCSPRAPL